MTHSINTRHTHSLVCAHSRTHRRARAHSGTRRHVWWAGARCLAEEGAPNQSASGPLILHWRASGTRAPGRSGGSETEQTVGGRRGRAAAAGRRGQAEAQKENPDPDSAKASFLSAVGFNPHRPVSATEIT